MLEARIGVVVIGRNEGERLRACLTSLQGLTCGVYVDSGSTDDSRAIARSLGFEVVDLGTPPGFTAARARNAGIARLLELQPDLPYVQTVDGDCELRTDWLAAAVAQLEHDDRRAVVFGRRRERRPHENAYHLACDIEWDVPPGEVGSCGGDALFRTAALRAVGGYNGALIAGEEPDLCLRLRQAGWRIWSYPVEMTWHDVAIHRFGQWWRRSQRTGFAIAELVTIHGAAADPGWRKLLASALVWSAVAGGWLAAAIAALVFRNPLSIVLLAGATALLALQLVRLAAKQGATVAGWRARASWAWLIMAAKAAQAYGFAQYHLSRLRTRPTAIIEYKG